KNVSITGTVSDTSSGVRALQAAMDGVSFNNIPFDSATGSFSFTTQLATNGTADGVHTIHLRAVDWAGNTSTALNRNFTLDTILPVVPISSPPSGLPVNHNATVTGKVTDSLTGVNLLRVAVDGGVYGPLSFDSQGNFAFTTAFALGGTADGLHTIHLKAF